MIKIFKKDCFRYHSKGYHYYNVPSEMIQVIKTKNAKDELVFLIDEPLTDDEMILVKKWFEENKYNRVAIVERVGKNGK